MCEQNEANTARSETLMSVDKYMFRNFDFGILGVGLDFGNGIFCCCLSVVR
jgi:hypothetical protein